MSDRFPITDRPWLDGAAPAPGRIARAFVRSDADRTVVEGHPPAELLPARTLHGCIESAAALEPAKTAMLLLDAEDPLAAAERVSYAELLGGIERAAVLFERAAEGARPVVSVICPLLPQALMAMWGAETVGAANPINPFLDVDGVVAILNALGSNVLVVGSPRYGAAVWNRLDDIVGRVPSLKAVWVIGAGAGDPRDFSAALARVDRSSFAALKVQDGAADASYMPTGGTTGAPKLVRHTQEGQLLNAWLVGALCGPGRDEVVGHGMPNFHVGGSVCIALRAIVFGQTLVTLTPDGFRNPQVIGRFWSIVGRHGVTNIIATPATAAALLANPQADHQGHGIHTFGCGGSTIPVDLLHAFHRRFGLYLREVWGMTEFHGVLTGHPNDGQLPVAGSVGRAFAYHRIRCARLEGNRYGGDAAPGERGVLIAQGPCVGSGYVEPRQNAELFVTGMPAGERWASSGDIGSIDETGHVWVFGREKDLIVRGGHKLDPRLIEDVLAQHAAVQLSAAVGRPDAQRGEMPIVYVQLKAGASATADELLGFCRERVAERAAAPVEVIVLPAIPMTAVGKIAKPTLRIDAMKRVAQQVAAGVAGAALVRGVDIDDAAARRTVVVRIADPGADRAALEQRLRAAFLGFEFMSRFEFVAP